MLRTSGRGWDVARYCVKHLQEVRAPDMAAALSFRTIFGLVPVLFVGTLITRSLAGERFPKFVESLAEMAGLNEIGLNVAAHSDTGVEKQQLSSWIEELVRFSGTLDLSALGLIGVVVVLFAAIWLIVAIENAFNIVCRAPNARPWHRRILVYWSVLTLGPLLLATLPLIDAEIRGFMESGIPLPLGYAVLRPVLGFSLLFALLFFTYLVIPTQRMRWKTVLVGALIGAIGLELGRHFLSLYMDRAFTSNKIYGSLGLVPVFMFWVYAMWLIVLFGLQVSSLLNALMSHERVREVLSRQSSTFEPAIAVQAVAWICDRFQRGEPATLEELTRTLHLDLLTATRLVELLAEANVVLHIAENGRLLPARSSDAIRVADALRVGFCVAGIDRTHERSDFVATLRQVQLTALENSTFGNLPDASKTACKKGESTAELSESNR